MSSANDFESRLGQLAVPETDAETKALLENLFKFLRETCDFDVGHERFSNKTLRLVIPKNIFPEDHRDEFPKTILYLVSRAGFFHKINGFDRTNFYLHVWADEVVLCGTFGEIFNDMLSRKEMLEEQFKRDLVEPFFAASELGVHKGGHLSIPFNHKAFIEKYNAKLKSDDVMKAYRAAVLSMRSPTRCVSLDMEGNAFCVYPIV